MEKVTVPQKRHCWICSSNEYHIILTAVNSEKMLKHCGTYLDSSIILKPFENETAISCCNYCYQSARQLTLLEYRIKKLQNEISDLCFVFSKNVLERRSRVKIEKEENVNELVPTTAVKYLTIQTNPESHATVTIEDLSVNEKVIGNVSKEFLSDSQGEIEKDDPIHHLWFGLEVHEKVNEDNCENGIRSEEDIDIKYSFDETTPRIVTTVNRDIPTAEAEHQQQATKIVEEDLLKCLKTPIIQLKRLQPSGSRVMPKIVAVAFEKTIKCENNLDGSNEKKEYSENESVGQERSNISRKTSNRTQTPKERRKYKKNKPTSYKCSFCSKTFPLEDRMLAHQRIHTGERPFVCGICAASFRSVGHLREHEKIVHSEEKPYKCSYCEKSFFRSRIHKDHERTHTGDRPYQCSHCDKSYSYKYGLYYHTKNHHSSFTKKTRKRDHKCSFCSKSFFQSSDVKRHERMHTGERPHKCSICEKTFSHKHHLTDHRKRVHGETNETFILS